jgi:hypothetical protein
MEFDIVIGGLDPVDRFDWDELISGALPDEPAVQVVACCLRFTRTCNCSANEVESALAGKD